MLSVSPYPQPQPAECLAAYLKQDFPPIAFINTGQLSYWAETTGHAVVVVGLENDLISLNDPACDEAPQKIAVAEFELAWLDLGQFYAIIEKK